MSTIDTIELACTIDASDILSVEDDSPHSISFVIGKDGVVFNTEACVIINREQAHQLQNWLTEWLAREHS